MLAVQVMLPLLLVPMFSAVIAAERLNVANMAYAALRMGPLAADKTFHAVQAAFKGVSL